jgi:hypothetical protein
VLVIKILVIESQANGLKYLILTLDYTWIPISYIYIPVISQISFFFFLGGLQCMNRIQLLYMGSLRGPESVHSIRFNSWILESFVGVRLNNSTPPSLV